MPIQNFVRLIRPGLVPADHKTVQLVLGTGETSIDDLIRPRGARPLAPGEWLELSGNTGERAKRGGDNDISVAGTPDNEGTAPAFLFHAPSTAHPQIQTSNGLVPIYVGPFPQEAEFTLCCSADCEPGDELSVWDYDGGDEPYGVVRRVLAKANSGFVVGRVLAVLGTDRMRVQMLAR